MSSKTTVMRSSTPPTRAATAKTQSSIGIVIIRGRPTLPARRRSGAVGTLRDNRRRLPSA